MIRNLLNLFLFFCMSFVFSQNHIEYERCSTDQLTTQYNLQFPDVRKKEDAFNLLLSQIMKSGNFDSVYGNKNNQIYEIPIVVHVVSDGSALGTPNNRSDAEIISWINHANDIFAGISAPGIAAVIPIKLVFAKIDPNCNATTGITHIDASNIPQYVSDGIDAQQNQAGFYQLDLTNIRKWDPLKYYNIYVVKETATGGVANGGWANYASYHGTNIDHAIIKQDAVTTPSWHHVLAHEFGHALGLRHTQEGSSGSICPANNDCTLEGDLVCDTEPTIDLKQAGSCQTGQINTCTGVLFAGVERNVMTYTNCYRDRFTTGQSNRAVAQLLQFRQSLLNSPVLSTSQINPAVSLTSACTPSTITNPANLGFGITYVNFGNINNDSKDYQQNFNNFYENFTTNYCLGKSVTTIPLNSATTITIKPGSQTTVPHIIKAYIDYNNDGQFNETTERILSQTVTSGSVITASIIPPSNSVQNTPLRMRIIGESNNFASSVNACYNPVRGQVEDYAVTIIGNTLTTTDNIKDNGIIITKQHNSVYVKSNTKITSVLIYDSVGRLIFAKENINLKEFSTNLFEINNMIFTVNVTLENRETLTKKIKF